MLRSWFRRWPLLGYFALAYGILLTVTVVTLVTRYY